MECSLNSVQQPFFPVKPQDALAAYISHVAFGATKMVITRHFGDERLFKPKNLTMEIGEPQDLLADKKKHSKV